jgi:hypothetical protein
LAHLVAGKSEVAENVSFEELTVEGPAHCAQGHQCENESSGVCENSNPTTPSQAKERSEAENGRAEEAHSPQQA